MMLDGRLSLQRRGARREAPCLTTRGNGGAWEALGNGGAWEARGNGGAWEARGRVAAGAACCASSVSPAALQAESSRW